MNKFYSRARLRSTHQCIYVLFPSFFRGILKAAKRLSEESNSTRVQKFYWLASDGWGKQSQVVAGIEDFAVGAITVELESKKIAGENDSLPLTTTKLLPP